MEKIYGEIGQRLIYLIMIYNTSNSITCIQRLSTDKIVSSSLGQIWKRLRFGALNTSNCFEIQKLKTLFLKQFFSKCMKKEFSPLNSNQEKNNESIIRKKNQKSLCYING